MLLIERSISHHKQKGGSVLNDAECKRKIQSADNRRLGFLQGNPDGKNHGEERRRIHYMFFVLQWGSPLSNFSSSINRWLCHNGWDRSISVIHVLLLRSFHIC